MNKPLAVLLGLSALILSLSIAYYLVVFIPQKEKAKADQQKNEQINKERNEQSATDQREDALNSCLSEADTDYNNYWNGECKGQGLLSASCISITEMTFDDYLKQSEVSEDDISGRIELVKEFYDKREDCSCRLPLDNVDIINESHQDDKDECFRKYPEL